VAADHVRGGEGGISPQLPRVTTHGLRRTFNNLARQTTSRDVLKATTGRSTDAMVEHYSLVSTDETTLVSRALATRIGVVAKDTN